MRRNASQTPKAISTIGQNCAVQRNDRTPRLSSSSNTPRAIRMTAPSGTPAGPPRRSGADDSGAKGRGDPGTEASAGSSGTPAGGGTSVGFEVDGTGAPA